MRAILNDNDPKHVASDLSAHLAAKGLEHLRIPRNATRSAERFHGTILNDHQPGGLFATGILGPGRLARARVQVPAGHGAWDIQGWPLTRSLVR